MDNPVLYSMLRLICETIHSTALDGKSVLREIRRERFRALVMGGVLGLSVGALLLQSVLVDALIARPLGGVDLSRVYLLSGAMQTPDIDPVEWFEQGEPSLQAVATYHAGSAVIEAGTTFDRVVVAEVSSTLAAVVPPPMKAGRWFRESDEVPGRAPVAVIRSDLAATLFGTSPAVNAFVAINGVSHRIVGTVAAAFNFPGSWSAKTPAGC